MLQIINYSDKAVAVIGDTRDYSERLKEMGGRFNLRLSCGAGWIFSKKILPKLEAFIKGEGGETTENKPKRNEALADARVYVGTYHKYNNGSIAGKWLDLIDYANKEEFLNACRELHKDESDPELMFQDWEGIPSWMIGESHIDAEVWDLKPEKETGKQTNEEKKAIYQKIGSKCDIDYAVKNCALLVESDGRYFDIHKPIIETKFCHPDEPADVAQAWCEYAKTYEHFRNENMSDINRVVKSLKEGFCTGNLDGLFIYKSDYYRTWSFGLFSGNFYLTEENEATPMDEKTKAILLKAYERVAKDFEKRLQSWWKRYGAEKLHIWTYWADA